MKREQWRTQAHACSAAMHDAGVWCPVSRKPRGLGVQGVESPRDLVSRGFGVQGVGIVITSRRDATHTARKLVID